MELERDKATAWVYCEAHGHTAVATAASDALISDGHAEIFDYDDGEKVVTY